MSSVFLHWHVSECLHAALPLMPLAQTKEPAQRLSYPSFVQPGSGEGAVLV